MTALTSETKARLVTRAMLQLAEEYINSSFAAEISCADAVFKACRSLPDCSKARLYDLLKAV